MRVVSTERLPIKMWLDDIEEGALEQARNLANLPFAYKWISIMPDCHRGYGMPIGGVLATKGVIIPNAVGTDIGCGVVSVRTSLTEIDNLEKIMGAIRKIIPVGFSKHKDEQDEALMPNNRDRVGICAIEYHSARRQLGTLGSGNHFIEVQKGDDGHVWIMIHSGSRNLGFRVASHYNKVAKELNEKWHSSVPAKWDLAFLPMDSPQGQLYKHAMQYCVDFALANRQLMMNRVMALFENASFGPIINIAHNYASLEHHYKQNVWVHRKGATKATKGLVGIIPGSQGTASYIVEGKGNPESFMSCSHGAGRNMSRTQARKELDLDTELKRMQGVVHSIRTQKDLDEAPGAYKDIDEVMANQSDLVNILVKLRPLAVIKG